MLAFALLVSLVGLDRPAAQAHQDGTPAIDDAFVPGDPQSATSGAFVSMPDRFISTANQPLLALLPEQDDAPAGFVLENQSERTVEDVASALGGADEVILLLQAWGWNGNVFRDFVLEEGKEAGPGGTTFLNVSLHRFADAEAAASALTYFSDQAAMSYDLRDGDAPAMGDSTRLLAGAPDGVSLAVLYVQRDQLLYRIGGSSADAGGDPAAEVMAVARTRMATYDAATPSPAP